MRRLLEIVGELYDLFKGASTTTVYVGEVRHEVHQIRPTTRESQGYEIWIRSRQIVYHTKYQRRWIPDSKRTVYEVYGYAEEGIPAEKRNLINPALFEKVTFPMLSNPLLKFTEYPHIEAIRAYMERARRTVNKQTRVPM